MCAYGGFQILTPYLLPNRLHNTNNTTWQCHFHSVKSCEAIHSCWLWLGFFLLEIYCQITSMTPSRLLINYIPYTIIGPRQNSCKYFLNKSFPGHVHPCIFEFLCASTFINENHVSTLEICIFQIYAIDSLQLLTRSKKLHAINERIWKILINLNWYLSNCFIACKFLLRVSSCHVSVQGV